MLVLYTELIKPVLHELLLMHAEVIGVAIPKGIPPSGESVPTRQCLLMEGIWKMSLRHSIMISVIPCRHHMVLIELTGLAL